jgi:hypothetical protein
MYVCIYVCVYIDECKSSCTVREGESRLKGGECQDIGMYVCMFMCVHICMERRRRMNTYMYVFMSVCVYMYVSTYAHT